MATIPSTDFGLNSSAVPLAVFPLTGNEVMTVDTQLTQGINPNMELISVAQIANYDLTAVVLTDAATVNIDLSLANLFEVVLSQNTTFTTTNAQSGSVFELILIQDATGSRTGTFPATWKFVGGSKTLTTTASATDKVSAAYDGTNFYCELNKAYA